MSSQISDKKLPPPLPLKARTPPPLPRQAKLPPPLPVIVKTPPPLPIQEKVLRQDVLALSSAVLLPPSHWKRAVLRGVFVSFSVVFVSAAILASGWFLMKVSVKSLEAGTPSLHLSQQEALKNNMQKETVIPEEEVTLLIEEPAIAALPVLEHEIGLETTVLPEPSLQKEKKAPQRIAKPKVQSKTKETQAAPKEIQEETGCPEGDFICDLIEEEKPVQAVLPETITTSEIQRVANRVIYAPCTSVGTGRVAIGATIDSSGNVQSAWGKTPLAECAAARFEASAHFSPIRSESQSFVVVVEVR